MSSPSPMPPPITLLLLAAALSAGCGSGTDGQAVELLPEGSALVEAGETRFQAAVANGGSQWLGAEGVPAAPAGLFPVAVSIDNRRGDTLKITPRQTFLVDADGNAWPLLTAGQSARRLQLSAPPGMGPVALADLPALTAFALDLKTGGNTVTRPHPAALPSLIRLARQDQRNPAVARGQAASGWLFFPGDGEVKTAHWLWLCYQQSGADKCVNLPLATAAKPDMPPADGPVNP